MTRNPLEYKLHIAILAHINSAFIGTHNPNLKIWHTPNQTRDATEAYFNKEMGVLPGVLDFFLAWPIDPSVLQKMTKFPDFKPKWICACVLEVKPPGESLSSPQNKFTSWAHKIGFHTGMARTVKQSHYILLGCGLNASHHTIIEPDYRTKEEKFKDAFDFYKPR